MPIPIKAHYAALAMLVLALRHGDGQPVSAGEMADDQSIPLPFLNQILQQLKSAGLVTSLRGSMGGYRLRRSPDQISVAEILAAVCPEAENSPPSDARSLPRIVYDVWSEGERRWEEHLQSVLLSDLTERARSASESAMFYI
jgi:Rrf2 family protein